MVEQVGGDESAISHWVTLPIYFILFVFETVLFIHFCISTRKGELKIKKAFLQHGNILILICLITLCLELWSVLVDLSTPLPSQDGYCWGQMYVRIMSFIFLDAIMFLFWIVRIRHTFAQSVFKLSKVFVTTIFIVVPFLVILLMAVLGIFMTPSYYAVSPNGYGCVVLVNDDNNQSVKGVLIFGQILAFSLNIFYGVLFYVKLSQFQLKCATSIQATARDPDGKPSALDVLSQKHTLLALISTISAIVAYLIFNLLLFTTSTESQSISALQFGFLLIDIDMVIKSVCLLLMFNIYTDHFYKWCFCCISLSAVDCSNRCKCCSTVNADDFNKRNPVFQRLKKQATISRLRLEKIEKKEDEPVYLGNKWDIDGEAYTAEGVDDAIGTVFYNVRDLKYDYLNLLVKVRTADHPKMETKIFQYASSDAEKMQDEDGIFKQADRQKYDYNQQDLTRHRNAAKIYGDFMDENEKHANLSKHKIYFRKSDPDYKWPFAVVVKANTNDEDGETLAYYVKEKIKQTLDGSDRLERFQYAPLLEGIVVELRSKKLDKNLLFRRVADGARESAKKSTKKLSVNTSKPATLKTYSAVDQKSPVSPSGSNKSPESPHKTADGDNKKDSKEKPKRRTRTDDLATAAQRHRDRKGSAGDASSASAKPLKRRTKTDELYKRAQTARENPLKKEEKPESPKDDGRATTMRDKLANMNIATNMEALLFGGDKNKDKAGNKSPTTPTKKAGGKTPTTPKTKTPKSKTPTSAKGGKTFSEAKKEATTAADPKKSPKTD